MMFIRRVGTKNPHGFYNLCETDVFGVEPKGLTPNPFMPKRETGFFFFPLDFIIQMLYNINNDKFKDAPVEAKGNAVSVSLT